MHVGDRIRRAREEKGWSQGRLGNEVGASQTAVSAWEGGRREPTREMVARIATALGAEPHELELEVTGSNTSEPLVPIIGRVGADNEGTVIQTTGQQGYDLAPIPPGGTAKAVALEVTGESMRWLAPSGSLVYFENQRTPPTPDMLGYYVIAELDDGRVLLKQLQRGSRPGVWGLQSQVGPLIEDVRIVWAAEPTAIIPPKQAQRIIRRAGERQVA